MTWHPGEFERPIVKAVRNQHHTVQAVARHMIGRRSGVVLTVTGGDREAVPMLGGTSVALAAIEAQYRQWACELGPHGVRVAWIRTTGLPETLPDTGAAVADLGTGYGQGTTREQIVADMRDETMLGRLPTLAELGDAASFLASDRASAMTVTLANVTCGTFLD